MNNRVFNLDSVDIKFEHILFLKLFVDDTFRCKVMPILNQRFFNPPQGQYPYDLIFKYFNKFYVNNQEDITPMQVIHAIQQGEKYLEHEDIKEIKAIFKQIFMIDEDGNAVNNVNEEYLLEEVEKFAQESSLELALIDSINIIEKKPEDKLMIRGLIDEALSVQLNKDIGLNYFENPLERFKFYQVREDKVPFGLDGLNKLTFNGFAKKTLNVFMAGTGIGKTLLMTSLAKDYILKGYKVLYVTLEISEKLIALRVDANILNIPISDFGRYENGKPVVNVNDLVHKFEDIKNNNKIGAFKIKEYPTGTTNTLQIKSLLKELKMKEDFKPDVLMVDYVNLMNSSRLSAKNNNTYNTVKAVAEELRGIAMEEELIVVTATQTNRDGITGNEVALDKVSESAGLPHTADFFCGIFQTEQQKEQGIYILKVLKNRYAGNTNKKIAFGVDYNFMRFYQLDNELEEEILDDSNDCDTDLENSTVFTPNRRRRR